MRRILAKYDEIIFAFSPDYLRITFRFGELSPETFNKTLRTPVIFCRRRQTFCSVDPEADAVFLPHLPAAGLG